MENYNLTPAFCSKDGEELLNRIKAEQPDVVLMDSFMTRLDAIGVMRSVRRDKLKAPLFIVFSSFHNAILEQQVMNSGASYFVLKPYDISELCQNIVNMTKRSKESFIGNPVTFDAFGIELKVTEILHEIGVPAHIKGYHYLRDSIIMSVEHPEIINAVTKQLYPSVAKKYETTSPELKEQFAMQLKLLGTEEMLMWLNSYFGYTIHNDRGKPTNSEFIAMISDKLRLQIKNASCKFYSRAVRMAVLENIIPFYSVNILF